MPDEKTPARRPGTDKPAPEAEPHIPRPPTREELKPISEEQALITDEWTGEEPGGMKPPGPKRD